MATYGELLSSGNFCSGVVCPDCLMGIANAEWPELGENWTKLQDDDADRFMAHYDVTLGHIHVGDYAEHNCYHYGVGCDVDCDCDRTEFSWEPCTVCKTSLGGYRHDIIVVARADMEASTNV